LTDDNRSWEVLFTDNSHFTNDSHHWEVLFTDDEHHWEVLFIKDGCHQEVSFTDDGYCREVLLTNDGHRYPLCRQNNKNIPLVGFDRWHLPSRVQESPTSKTLPAQGTLFILASSFCTPKV
jgi:hypothetical protein